MYGRNNNVCAVVTITVEQQETPECHASHMSLRCCNPMTPNAAAPWTVFMSCASLFSPLDVPQALRDACCSVSESLPGGQVDYRSWGGYSALRACAQVCDMRVWILSLDHCMRTTFLGGA